MKKVIAKDLLDIQAVFLKPQEPFTWASGIKSPIYCDNRLTLSYPKVREDVENALAEIIRKEYPTCNMVMGTSTAGYRACGYRCDNTWFTNGLCTYILKRSWTSKPN